MTQRFVLIHGANGSASSWEPLRVLLDDAVAPSLPIEDRDAGFADYAAACPDGDVIVGHSMGGITASLVARRCGARVVYVAAFLPRAGATLGELLGEMVCPEVRGGLKRRDGLDFWRDPEAFGMDPAGLRGQSITPYFDVLEDPVPGRYVGCRRDLVVRPDYQAGLADVWLDCGHEAARERPAELAALL